jgi:signal transduction histidine kinase/DNA-binding response OmpR family regulator/HPt (histidine-containing phosphotransfer) domain-containing protein
MNESKYINENHENKRVDVLMSYEIMDTPPEVELDEITKIAYLICDTPISLISLLDKGRQWFKSNHGLGCSETPKGISFCQYAILNDDLFVVEDSLLDERFKNNPLVIGEPYIRFYAGMPLRTPSGYNIGTLCVIDRKPKKINETHRFVMKSLAKQVITNFELRKTAKELIKLNQKTLNISKAKEQFFSNMSHELRTPLNAISGFTEILGHKLLGHEEKEQLGIIKSSVDILISIINDVLDYSKIESGNLKIENNPFNLRKLLKSIYELLRIKAREKKISLRVNMEKTIPSNLNGDIVRLNQILMNLLGNAIKFTTKGYVSLNITLLKDSGDEVEIKFSISDTGIGIPCDKIKELFQRFHQVEGTARKFGGSGLGLNISKSMVELQNGNLEVRSVYGKGSIFSFSLKYKKSTQEEIDKLLQEEKLKECYFKPDFKGLRVLLAEDNIMNVKLLQKIFEGTGLILDVSENGKVCIEKINAFKYDLILMDLFMPIMDGYEATNYIRKKMKLNIPIIGISANTSDVDRKKSLDVGMNEYVTKPFKIQELFRNIAKVLNRNDFCSKRPITKNLPIKSQENFINIENKQHINNNEKYQRSQSNNISILPVVISKGKKTEGKLEITTNNSDTIIKLKNESKMKMLCKDERINKTPPSCSNMSEMSTSRNASREEILDKINIESLKEYSGDDEEFEKQLIEIFIKEVPDYLQSLESEIHKENLSEIKKAAHKLKSPLGIFGLNILIKKFDKIEKLTEQCDKISISYFFQSCSNNLEKILLEMRNLLNNYPVYNKQSLN